MALVKCKECGKQISSNANACPACGNPIGGSSNAGVNAFERRIEEYKKSGYVQIKKDSNSATMRHSHKYAKGVAKDVLTSFLLAIIAVSIVSLISYFVLESMLITQLVIIAIGLIFLVSLIRIPAKYLTVNITISQNGKIEEIGNVLKSK